MRIHVKDGENNIRILLPTGLVFSRLTAMIGVAVIKKYAPERGISAKQIDALFAEFHRIKRRYGRWELVDVESADGQIVKIIL